MGKVIKAIAGPVLGLIIGGGKGFVQGLTNLATAYFGGPVLAALSIAGTVLAHDQKAPQPSQATLDRLRAGLDTRAARKIVFGHTAAALDVHYQEYTGTKQDSLNSIIVLASHAIQDVEEVWFDETKIIDGGVHVDSETAGHLGYAHRTEGTVAGAFTITGSTTWVASTCRLIGCAYMWLRYDLSKKSPFAQNVTSRITVKVKGALLYDPRLDSTRGGSGGHRADNQATWGWPSYNVGRNPALQLLWYLIGWRIQNPADSTWKLAVGLGLPLERIDFASFAAAANICDEPVTLAAGGTEPRYRSDGVFSEDDAPETVFANLLAAMNGVLRDSGGKLVLDILTNDLGSPVADFTHADVIGEYTWLQTPPIDQSFNVVRGQYVDSSDAGLFQMVDYPDVSIDSIDGIERPRQFDFAMVQSASQAQRLAKTFLQRAQYPGTFTADFLASAWRCEVGSVVRLTFPALGFENKLFRVVQHQISPDGKCPMVLREENAAIYAWDAEESPAVVAVAPIRYDPLNGAVIAAINDTIDDAGLIKEALVPTVAIVEDAVTNTTFDEWNDTRSLPYTTGDYQYIVVGGLIFPDAGRVHIHAEFLTWLTYDVTGLTAGSSTIGARFAITKWTGGAPSSTDTLADYVTAGATVVVDNLLLLMDTYDGTVASGTVTTEKRTMSIDYIDTAPGTDGIWYAIWAKMNNSTGSGSVHTSDFQRMSMTEIKR